MILLVVGVVLLVKRRRKTKKVQKENSCETELILYQDNVTQKFNSGGQQQLRHEQESFIDTTMTKI